MPTVSQICSFPKENPTIFSFLWRILLYRFTSGAVPIFVFYNLMQTEYGLSGLQISTNIIAQMIATLLTNIPAGIISDRYSRKYTLIMDPVFHIIAFICFLVSKSFLSFLVGHILIGIGISFLYGTLESLIYDELALQNKQQWYQKSMLASYTAFNLGIAFGCLLVLPIINSTTSNYNLALIISLVITVAGSASILTIQEAPHATRLDKGITKPRGAKILSEAIKIFTTSPQLLTFCLCAAFLTATYRLFIEFWTNIAHDSQWSKETISIFSFFILWVGVFIVYRTRNFHTSARKLLLISVYLSAFTFIFAIITSSFIPILLPLVFTCVITIGDIVFNLSNIAISRYTTSDTQSTVLSFFSSMGQFLQIIFCLLFGFLTTTLNERYDMASHIFTHITTISIVLLGLIALKYNKSTKKT